LTAASPLRSPTAAARSRAERGFRPRAGIGRSLLWLDLRECASIRLAQAVAV